MVSRKFKPASQTQFCWAATGRKKSGFAEIKPSQKIGLSRQKKIRLRPKFSLTVTLLDSFCYGFWTIQRNEISTKSDSKTLRLKSVFAELPCKNFLVPYRASLLPEASVLGMSAGFALAESTFSITGFMRNSQVSAFKIEFLDDSAQQVIETFNE